MENGKMSLEKFQKEVFELKSALDWHKYHTPKELLLGMVEEIGEFRNIIKWKENSEEIKNLVLGIKKSEEKDDSVLMNEKQHKQLFYFAKLNGKINTDKKTEATDWIKEKAGIDDINKITFNQAEKLISKFIREEIIDFFGDMMWYLGSLADFCKVDLEKTIHDIIQGHKSRFPIEKVQGKTASPVSGEYNGKYENK